MLQEGMSKCNMLLQKVKGISKSQAPPRFLAKGCQGPSSRRPKVLQEVGPIKAFIFSELQKCVLGILVDRLAVCADRRA